MARHRKTGSTTSTPEPKPRVGSSLDTATPFRWRNATDRIHLLVVVAAALILRILFFYLNQRNNPVFLHPIMDALYHDEWARDILAGGTRGDDVFFRAPLYPYLLALLYKAGGSSISFVVFVQHLIGTVTATLTFLLAREFVSRRVSLSAGIVAALYWPFVYFEGELLIVTLVLSLNGFAFLFLARALKTGSMRLHVAAGLALGLSAIARPSILVFFPAIPLIMYLREGRGQNRSWLRHTAVIAAMASLPILPVMVRNYVVGRSIVPIAASGGVNFYIGNSPASDGSTAIVPGTRADWWGGYEDAIAIAERDAGRKLGLAEVSTYYFHRGFEFIGTRPSEAWRLTLKKARMFWAAQERSNNKFIYFFWHLAGMKYVPLPGFWLVAPLGLLGLVLLWPRRREMSLFYLFTALYSAGVIAFFVNARFRLPVVPMLIIAAAYGGHVVVDVFRRRDSSAVRILLVLATCILIVESDYMNYREVREYQKAFSYNTLGNAYLKMGMTDTALSNFQRALDINRARPTPAFASYLERDINYNVGIILSEKGLCSRAIECLEKVGGSDVFAVIALDHLGGCYLLRNDVAHAAAAFQRIGQIDASDPRGVTGMARCYAAGGNLAEAERTLTAIVEPGKEVYPPAWIALAEIQRSLGKQDEAIASYLEILRFVGFEKQAYVALIELYRETGDLASARTALEKARRYFSANDPTYNSLVNAVRTGR